MREFTKGTGSELSCFRESRCAFQLGACPLCERRIEPNRRYGDRHREEFYPQTRNYRTEPVPVSTPFMKYPGYPYHRRPGPLLTRSGDFFQITRTAGLRICKIPRAFRTNYGVAVKIMRTPNTNSSVPVIHRSIVSALGLRVITEAVRVSVATIRVSTQLAMST